MKAKVRGVDIVKIDGEYIRLDALLKYAGAVGTGGNAKEAIQKGEAFIDGSKCIQRGKKIYIGHYVKFRNNLWRIAAVTAK